MTKKERKKKEFTSLRLKRETAKKPGEKKKERITRLKKKKGRERERKRKGIVFLNGEN